MLLVCSRIHPENNRMMLVDWSAPSLPALVSLAVHFSFVLLAVLKSDNANGLFGFHGPCSPSSTDREDAVFECPIFRERGDADRVEIHWQVLQRLGQSLTLATDDFMEAEGDFVFQPGERLKVRTCSRTLEVQIQSKVPPHSHCSPCGFTTGPQYQGKGRCRP